MKGGGFDDGKSLARLLASANRGGPVAEEAIREIVGQHAQPQIDRLLTQAVERRMLPASEAADLGHDVVVRLLRKLRRVTEDRDTPITLLPNYVGAVFRHCLEDRRRLVDPERTNLALRMRYVLTHTPSLAMWGNDPILCGLAQRAGERTWGAVPAVGLLEAPGDDARALRVFLEQLLRRAAGPVEFWQLLDEVANGLGLTADRFVGVTALRRVSALPDGGRRLENRQYLQQLWEEIKLLPVNQRRALLLNVRLDTGDSIARALATLRIAGVRPMAIVLEMALTDVLALWDDLPLPDARIAAMLELTRQQVINLRKAARERLARRLARPEDQGGGA